MHAEKLVGFCVQILFHAILPYMSQGHSISYKIVYTLHIGVDKSGYQVSFFLISPRKHML